MTGHEHSYERSHLMANFETKAIKSKSNTLRLVPGASFSVVAGLGGDSIRPWRNGSQLNPWWAATAALDNGVNYGALLCEYGMGRHGPLVSNCVFRDIDGVEWDRFKIRVERSSKKSGGVQSADIKTDRFMEHAVSGIESFYNGIPTVVHTENNGIPTGTDTENNGIPTETHTEKLSLTEGTFHLLSFRLHQPGVTTVSESPITSIHLQMMITMPRNLSTTGNIHISAGGSQSNLSPTSHQSVLYLAPKIVSQSLDGIESGEVWVSKNLIDLFDIETLTDLTALTLKVSGSDVDEEISILGHHPDLLTCVLPTLVVIY